MRNHTVQYSKNTSYTLYVEAAMENCVYMKQLIEATLLHGAYVYQPDRTEVLYTNVLKMEHWMQLLKRQFITQSWMKRLLLYLYGKYEAI